jgi:dihydrofolate synthase/folylpolyglutamate synthase
MKPLTSYDEALAYVDSKVPSQFPGSTGLERMESLLAALDNPQEKLRIVHLAGTSGKGSTATLIAALLKSQGFSVGLHLSPHVADIRERLQVDGELISKEEFTSYLQDIIPVIEQVSSLETGMVTYFELLVALAYHIFLKKKVQYAVIETGLGGLLDGTNCVHRSDKLAVLTKIGLDHMHILGTTLPEIATQKAGIIQLGNEVLALVQDDQVMEVFEKAALTQKAHLVWVSSDEVVTQAQVTATGNIFSYNWRGLHLSEVKLAALGRHQIENATLALSTLQELAERDQFKIQEEALRSALSTTTIIGRLQKVEYQGRQLLLDGAHNPQKMQALVSSIQQFYPGQTLPVLLAVKEGKDTEAMLAELLPITSELLITTFGSAQDLRSHAQDVQEIGELAKRVGFTTVTLLPNLKEALTAALVVSTSFPLLITGSLYLMGDVMHLIANTKE